MRAVGPSMSLTILGLLAIGCADRDPLDPGAVVREETVNRVGPPSRASSRTVRCACDADGDLHVRAPQGSTVVRPEDATYDAEAEIVLADDPPRPAPLRRTKSLGFIGDNKLTPSPSRGGPWAVPDALLPPHQHVGPRYGTTHGWYRPYSYPVGTHRAWAAPVATPAPSTSPPPTSVSSPGAAMGAGWGAPAAPAAPAGRVWR